MINLRFLFNYQYLIFFLLLKIKEKITAFTQPFIYLMNEEISTHDKKIKTFLDFLMIKIFNVDWISLYLESDLKSPIYISSHGKKIKHVFSYYLFNIFTFL